MVTDGLLIVYNAQRARGLEMDKGGMAARVKQWGALLSPLMIVLLKWTDLMAVVFQAPGLDFCRQHTPGLRGFPFPLAHWGITTVVLGGLAAFIVLYQLHRITFNVG